MKAWSSGRSDILLELSGGLDSSIIAASLAAADADFSAINFATPGADGDERHFARAVAERVGAAMIEARNDDTRIDLLSPPAILHPRPGAYGVLGGLDQAFEEAGGGKAKSVIGGIGGDNVFAFDSSIGPAVDAFEQYGVSRRTFAVLQRRIVMFDDGIEFSPTKADHRRAGHLRNVMGGRLLRFRDDGEQHYGEYYIDGLVLVDWRVQTTVSFYHRGNALGRLDKFRTGIGYEAECLPCARFEPCTKQSANRQASKGFEQGKIDVESVSRSHGVAQSVARPDMFEDFIAIKFVPDPKVKVGRLE